MLVKPAEPFSLPAFQAALRTIHSKWQSESTDRSSSSDRKLDGGMPASLRAGADAQHSNSCRTVVRACLMVGDYLSSKPLPSTATARITVVGSTHVDVGDEHLCETLHVRPSRTLLCLVPAL